MATSTRRVIASAALALALAWPALAQDPAAERPTTEQRLAALESGLATLDTRLALAIARPPETAGQSDLALAARIAALERALDRLSAELQRVERLADSAARAAGEAQRDATSAQQAARDAALRAR